MRTTDGGGGGGWYEVDEDGWVGVAGDTQWRR